MVFFENDANIRLVDYVDYGIMAVLTTGSESSRCSHLFSMSPTRHSMDGVP